MTLRLAAAQYPIDAIVSWDAYEAKLRAWFAAAVEGGAQLLVFPEYGAMELARIAGEEVWSDLQRSIDFISELRPRVDALHVDLACQHRVHVVAASLPERDVNDGRAYNVARLITPSGEVGVQRKIVMTRFEREAWDICGGRDVCVFDTPIGLVGIAICYDAEFPLISRAMCEAGAELILVPSCTEGAFGYHRVRVGAQARALENQCHVVQSPTVGTALWSPAVDLNHGAAGVFGPPDLGFPVDGVISLGVLNEPQWVFADINPAAVERVRREGAVLNHAHWREQPGVPDLAARLVRLRPAAG
jgi:predicted amidohydrolase